MRKKHRKMTIKIIIAFGLLINFSSNIHIDSNNHSKTISILSEPIIGDH